LLVFQVDLAIEKKIYINAADFKTDGNKDLTLMTHQNTKIQKK
jgi:hypothetical protein